MLSKNGSFIFKPSSEREKGFAEKIEHWQLETPKGCYTFMDSPGQKEYAKIMISGISQADAAILFVSCRKRDFKLGISKEGQTLKHALVAFTFGVKQLIVACNKMDKVEYSEERYLDVKSKMLSRLTKIGYKESKIHFVPISGFVGDNLVESSSSMPWYKGPTLVEIIDSLEFLKRATTKPLRIPIRDIYRIRGVGVV